MLGGYVDVKNRGFNETISSNNNKTNVSKIRWDANYNGNHGNMTLDLSRNGRKKHIDVAFDNQDLAEILNVPAVNLSLERRLKRDFLRENNKTRRNHYNYNNNYDKPMIIEIVRQPSKNTNTNTNTNTTDSPYDFENVTSTNPVNLIQSSDIFSSLGDHNRKLTHLSSPEMDEELILPLSKYSTSTSSRKKNRKSTKKYKVLRKPKSSKKSYK